MLQIWGSPRSMSKGPRCRPNPTTLKVDLLQILGQPAFKARRPSAPTYSRNSEGRCVANLGEPHAQYSKDPLSLLPDCNLQGRCAAKIRAACAQCIEGPTSLAKRKQARTMCCKFGQPVLNAMKVLLTKFMVDVLLNLGMPALKARMAFDEGACKQQC